MRAKQVYAAIVIFLTVVGLFVSNVAYTNHVDGRRAAADRAAAAARAQQGVQIQAALCAAVTAMIVVYEGAATPVGQQVRQAWTDLGQRFGCR